MQRKCRGAARPLRALSITACGAACVLSAYAMCAPVCPRADHTAAMCMPCICNEHAMHVRPKKQTNKKNLRGEHERRDVAGGAPPLQCRPAAAGAAARRRGATGRITGGCDLASLERDVERGGRDLRHEISRDRDLRHEISQHRQHRVRDSGAARHRAAGSCHALTAAAGRASSAALPPPSLRGTSLRPWCHEALEAGEGCPRLGRHRASYRRDIGEGCPRLGRHRASYRRDIGEGFPRLGRHRASYRGDIGEGFPRLGG